MLRQPKKSLWGRDSSPRPRRGSTTRSPTSSRHGDIAQFGFLDDSAGAIDVEGNLVLGEGSSRVACWR